MQLTSHGHHLGSLLTSCPALDQAVGSTKEHTLLRSVLSIEVLGGRSGLRLHMPNLESSLQQLAMYTDCLGEPSMTTMAQSLSERDLRFCTLRLEGDQSHACNYLTPSNCVDPPACRFGYIRPFFHNAVDIPWASCGHLFDQLPSS